MADLPRIRFGADTLTLDAWPTVGQVLPVLQATKLFDSDHIAAITALVPALADALGQNVEAVRALTLDELEAATEDFLGSVRRPATPRPQPTARTRSGR